MATPHVIRREPASVGGRDYEIVVHWVTGRGGGPRPVASALQHGRPLRRTRVVGPPPEHAAHPAGLRPEVVDGLIDQVRALLALPAASRPRGERGWAARDGVS